MESFFRASNHFCKLKIETDITKKKGSLSAKHGNAYTCLLVLIISPAFWGNTGLRNLDCVVNGHHVNSWGRITVGDPHCAKNIQLSSKPNFKCQVQTCSNFVLNWEGFIILEKLLSKNTYRNTAKENETSIKTSQIQIPACPSKSKRNVV